METGLDVISPDTDLTRINGIGPSYEEQLQAKGVVGVVDFLGVTGTSEDRRKLSEQTGFSVGTIESWRDQVELSRIDGIGGVYQRLLHRADIWTLGDLQRADAAELSKTLSQIDLPDAPEQMPSICFGVTPRASPSRNILAPGGSEVRLREARESSSLTGSAT